MITQNIRGYDPQGAGHWQARRGSRRHNGVDFVCGTGDEIRAFNNGLVTKIGYPYNPSDIHKGHLRYVEITDKRGLKLRYFYVLPNINFGDVISAGGVIGESQNLMTIYPGITQHFHFEIKSGRDYINPHKYFERRG